jgi:hypothetical protein
MLTPFLVSFLASDSNSIQEMVLSFTRHSAPARFGAVKATWSSALPTESGRSDSSRGRCSRLDSTSENLKRLCSNVPIRRG